MLPAPLAPQPLALLFSRWENEARKEVPEAIQDLQLPQHLRDRAGAQEEGAEPHAVLPVPTAQPRRGCSCEKPTFRCGAGREGVKL